MIAVSTHILHREGIRVHVAVAILNIKGQWDGTLRYMYTVPSVSVAQCTLQLTT